MSIRCYNCGRFIGYDEFDRGAATSDYPDFERAIALAPPDPVPMHTDCNVPTGHSGEPI